MDDHGARADKAARKAARKAANAADHHNHNDDVDGDGGGDAQDRPPRKKSRKEHRGIDAAAQHGEPQTVAYDHSHLPIPQLHPSLAGLVPQQQQQQHHHLQAQRGAPPPVPDHYQQAAHAVGSGSSNGQQQQQQHRDIPVDPVLLGLLPTPPAHFSTSSVRSGSGGRGGGSEGRGGHPRSVPDQQHHHHQEAVEAAAAAAAAVAELARGGGGGGGGGGAATTNGVKGGGSKKRKDKGKEKAKPDNIEVVATAVADADASTGADNNNNNNNSNAPPAAVETGSSAPNSAAEPERFEPLHDLYGQVERILGPDHHALHHQKRTGHDGYTGRKASSGAGAGAGGAIGAEGVEKAKGGFYDQLRSKWMSTKDLKQLAEQYGATYKQGKFSLAEDTTLREAMEQFRLSRGLTPADLRRLLVTKRDVRKPLAHGQSQNEIWEYLAQALGDRPLLSIYNHVKLLVAGDPIEAAPGSATASATGTPQPDATGVASGSEATPGPATDAQAVASGSGTGTAGGGGMAKAGSTTPKPNFATVPGPSLEGVLGDANRKGRWTADEDRSLARLLTELGTSWNEIGRQLGRSGTACRDRWTKQLNNGLALGLLPNGESVPVQKAKEGKWTDAEVAQLKALHAEFGSQWKLISTKMGGTRTSTQCRTKWTDYIARREAAGLGKVEAEQDTSAVAATAAAAVAPGARKDSAAAREDWRWHASDGSRLIHAIAALDVSDPTEIDWKAIDDPRLALHGAKNLRDRFRHLVKNAKLEVQREVGSIAEVPFKDALAHLLIQHPTPDYDPSQAVSDAEKAQQRARRRAERKAAKKAEREQRAGAAQAAALHVAGLGSGLDAGPVAAAAAAAAYMQQQQQHAPIGHPPARAMGAPEHLIGRTSHLSQAYVDDSDGSDDDRGDIRVDVMGRRV
ncbi:hypothetical protein JCM3774_000395 [Rhodotorula dairenensis]